jgi:ketosteroid isomerase-like protein
MNLPKRAEDAHSTLAAAYNTGDLETVLGMYETSGIIMVDPGKPVSGHENFTAVVKAILSIKGKMEIKTVYCLQTGDTAVGRSEWSIKDGNEVKVSAKGIEVMKRQPDGGWKVLIDHTFGAVETLTA